MPPALMDIVPADADARRPYGPHASQFVDFRRPAAGAATPAPLVIMIHGGFWRTRRTLTYAGHLCIALSQAGFATANIEYRRTGEDGGGWPGTYQDVKSAIDFSLAHAPEFSADPGRTVLLGHSAGGHLALLASADYPGLRGAISLGGVANLRRACELHLGEDVVLEFMNGSPCDLPGAYFQADPVNRPAAIPRVLIHGTADDIVPCEISREFPEPRLYIDLPGCDHFELIDPSTAAWQTVLSEIIALTRP
jgi:dipeptidyl aminopeptidase/acylaminoacyl peptidase